MQPTKSPILASLREYQKATYGLIAKVTRYKFNRFAAEVAMEQGRCTTKHQKLHEVPG